MTAAMLTVRDHSAYLEQVQHRSKRRRLDVGLPAAEAKELHTVARSESHANEASLPVDQQKKALAYGPAYVRAN